MKVKGGSYPETEGAVLERCESSGPRRVPKQRVYIRTSGEQAQLQIPFMFMLYVPFHCPHGFQIYVCFTDDLRSSIKIEILGLKCDVRRQSLQQ